MSIATEIERIQNAKTSIKTAIENKGVVVGEGLIDTYASKIDEITGGGGGGGKYAPSAISFYNAKASDLSYEVENLDTSNMTNMSYMFYGALNVKTLDLSHFNTSKVTEMGSMFQNNSSLKSLNVSSFDTSNVTAVAYMFYNMGSLTDLDLKNFNLEKVNYTSNFMYSLANLVNLTFGYNFGKGFTQKTNNYSSYNLDLSQVKKLSHDSLMDVINKLYDLNLTYDVANGGTLYTQRLYLGSANIAKLTNEELSVATNKGWVVS